MPFKIKIRLAELGKKQVDLIPELAKKELTVNPTELSLAISGRISLKLIKYSPLQTK